MIELPKRRTLVHKAIEPRKLSAKVAADISERPKIYELKYDGCHCFIVKDGDRIEAFSRQGEVVPAAMEHIKVAMTHMASGVYFGEAWHPNLPHSEINGTFRRTYRKEGAELLHFVIFDYVPLADFHAGKCPIPYHTRRWFFGMEVLKAFSGYIGISVARETLEDLEQHLEFLRENTGHAMVLDGFMQKLVEGTWSAGSGSGGEALKLKDVLSVDVEVVSVFEGLGKFTGMVGGLTVRYGGQECKVGGGKLTDKERKLYWDFPGKIIGSIVEVHALGETADGLLREGRFIRRRDDKTKDEAE